MPEINFRDTGIFERSVRHCKDGETEAQGRERFV